MLNHNESLPLQEPDGMGRINETLFYIYEQDREGCVGGGIALHIKDNIQSSKLENTSGRNSLTESL